MKIRITEGFVTAHYPVNPGDTFDCPNESALELIESGRAVAVAQSPASLMEQPSRGPVAELRSNIASSANSMKYAAKKSAGKRR